MKYDVALSFAGEDRKYVEAVANELKNLDIKVFYDKFETVNSWGKDLFTHLQNVYQKEAKYVVIFISAYYAKKVWTNHERKMAQARDFEESSEYILPARFDDTEIEGITRTTAYIDLTQYSPENFANLIKSKLNAGIIFEDSVSTNSSALNESETERIKTLENKKSNFVFLFGKANVGKTTLIASILYYLTSSTSIEVLNNPKEEYKYKKFRNYLLSSIKHGKLLYRTGASNLFEIEVNIMPEYAKQSLPITFLDMAGEDLSRIEINEESNELPQFPAYIDVYFKAKNIPLTFILLTTREAAQNDDLIMLNFLEYVKNNGINSNVLLIVTRQNTDLSNWETVDFVKENMPLTFAHIPNAINSIKEFYLANIPYELQYFKGYYDEYNTEIVVNWIIKNLIKNPEPVDRGFMKKLKEFLEVFGYIRH